MNLREGVETLRHAKKIIFKKNAMPVYLIHFVTEVCNLGCSHCFDFFYEQGPKRKLAGLELEGRRIARQGMPVVKDGNSIGQITSGTFSPTLQKSIAMAFVDAPLTTEGTELAVDLKGTINPAKIVKLPFYKRS